MLSEKRIFNIKMFILLFPFILIYITVLSMDPFKVWFYYDDYYKNNFVSLNRELICFRIFEHNKEKYKYNSFILGNSRSRAFKIKKWIKYLPKNSSGFHFDASGEGIYGINNKLRYFEKNKLDIKNVLIVLDNITLTITKNRKGHIYISPPELSEESRFNFYKEYFLAGLSLRFSIAYLDYRKFGKFRSYMNEIITGVGKYDDISDNETGDFYYSYDNLIKDNEKEYYEQAMKDGVFYDRKEVKPLKITEISSQEISILQSIREILKRHNTNYKIVISPIYSQIPFDIKRLELLNNLFGKENIYNFSGKNNFTESMYNYYEASHYRTHVADQIMKEIYLGKKNIYLSKN